MKIRLLAFLLFIATGFVFAQTTPGNVGPRGNSYDDPANGIYVSPSGDDARATGAKAGDVYSFGLSGLDGNPTMHDNCYYVAGKSATFTDNRPGSTLEKAGLAAWKTHIGGDAGSLEVNPTLDANYMTTNTQCAGMGIQSPLIVNKQTGINSPVLFPETVISISNGIL